MTFSEEKVHEWKLKGLEYHLDSDSRDWAGWLGITSWKCDLFSAKILTSAEGRSEGLEVLPEPGTIPSLAVLMAWLLAAGPLRAESMASLKPVSPIALVPLSPQITLTGTASSTVFANPQSPVASMSPPRSPTQSPKQSPRSPQPSPNSPKPMFLGSPSQSAARAPSPMLKALASTSSGTSSGSFGFRPAGSAVLAGRISAASSMARVAGSFHKKPSSGFAMHIMHSASLAQTLAASQTFIEEKWSDSYNTGVWILDVHHKLMFMIIRKLFDQLPFVSQEFLGEILSEATAYARYHFRSEEELFDTYEIPEHKGEHRKFESQLDEFQKKHVAGQLNGEGLGEFLQAWFVHHICVVDKAACVSLLRKWPDAGSPSSGEEQALQAFRIVRAMREANATHTSNAGLSLPLAIINAVVAATQPTPRDPVTTPP